MTEFSILIWLAEKPENQYLYALNSFDLFVLRFRKM